MNSSASRPYNRSALPCCLWLQMN